MYRVLQILTVAEVAQCRQIATSAPFIDGRISNPHNTAKQNEQLHDPQAYQKSSELLKTAFIQLPGATIRSDLSCTIFLNEPKDYEGGELHLRLGDADLTFKLKPGEAIIYPSDSLHQVVPVTKGERLVAITFIQSRIQDPFRRNLLYELNEVAALEGLKMDVENFGRLQLIQQNLLRYWGDMP